MVVVWQRDLVWRDRVLHRIGAQLTGECEAQAFNISHKVLDLAVEEGEQNNMGAAEPDAASGLLVSKEAEEEEEPGSTTTATTTTAATTATTTTATATTTTTTTATAGQKWRSPAWAPAWRQQVGAFLFSV